MREIRSYGELDDAPHTPSGDSNWQESALFTWYDREAGTGGFWRLGQEPANCAANSCFGVFTRDGLRFRANVTGVPMTKSDRGDAHMGLGTELRVNFGGSPRIQVVFPDCEADLRFDDFHSRFAYHDLVGATSSQDSSAHHFEVAGSITGNVRIGDQVIKVNALGYRDRSWGARTWGTLRSTRWWPCVFGPDLSLHVLHYVIDSGHLTRVGYVLRDGIPRTVLHSDLVVQIESDALSPRHGEATLELDDGETLRIVCDVDDGIALHVRGYTAVEAIGVVRLGDRLGVCDLEVCTNPAGGSKAPVLGLRANITQGLSRR